jgi:hypothetical protein
MLSAATTNLFGMGDTEMSRNIENMSLEKFNRILLWNQIGYCNKSQHNLYSFEEYGRHMSILFLDEDE